MDDPDPTDSPVTIYDDEVFKMACDQFSVIADYLNIDEGDREWATSAKRAVAVTLPVHMDDGSTRAFQGYRVQHHIAGSARPRAARVSRFHCRWAKRLRWRCG